MMAVNEGSFPVRLFFILKQKDKQGSFHQKEHNRGDGQNDIEGFVDELAKGGNIFRQPPACILGGQCGCGQ